MSEARRHEGDYTQGFGRPRQCLGPKRDYGTSQNSHKVLLPKYEYLFGRLNSRLVAVLVARAAYGYVKLTVKG